MIHVIPCKTKTSDMLLCSLKSLPRPTPKGAYSLSVRETCSDTFANSDSQLQAGTRVTVDSLNYTPAKIDLKPEDDGLEDSVPLPEIVFSGSMLIFRGVVHQLECHCKHREIEYGIDHSPSNCSTDAVSIEYLDNVLRSSRACFVEALVKQ